MNSFENRDCMEAMHEMPDKAFDLAIVDPPYGYRHKSTAILNFRKKVNADWNIAPSKEYWRELFRVSKNQIVWGGNYFPELWGRGCRGFIIWYKQNPVPNFADCEMAWTSYDINARVFRYRYYGNHEGGTNKAPNIFHPTQKPVELYRWLLHEYAQPGDTILDTHVGSGSSLLACIELGFQYTGYEIDKDYFDKAKARLAAAPLGLFNENA